MLGVTFMFSYFALGLLTRLVSTVCASSLHCVFALSVRLSVRESVRTVQLIF